MCCITIDKTVNRSMSHESIVIENNQNTYIFEQIEWNLKTHMKLNKIPALSSFRHV